MNVRIANAQIKITDKEYYGGGIVGQAQNVRFENCWVETAEIEVKDNSAGGMAGNAANASFESCRVETAKIDATGSNAGGMAGDAENASFESCRVYWTKPDALKEGASGMEYMINGQNAGGLAGWLTMEESNQIENSFAATTISGNVAVGGLVGSLESSSSFLAIQKSYADCYLSGTGYVGGLVGESKDSGIKVTNVYSAGFISCPDLSNAGGLCASGTMFATNSYAAIYYSGKGVVATPLASGVTATFDKCCFVAYEKDHFNSGADGMIDYVDRYDMTLGDAFEVVTEANTVSYGADNVTRTGAYPFMGLKDLPHYGDWKVINDSL